MAFNPIVDEEKCAGCEECVDVCPVEVFEMQDEAYREQVLPASVSARVVIEAGVTEAWWRYAGPAGRVIGIDRFGESAPANELFEHFGFSTGNVVAVARELI